ncbi:MAG: hypothetical protein J5663_09725, partial [Bacteroidaceae bacterium]|nr:hypothetical protein [Bacteroidaceae bacterium]
RQKCRNRPLSIKITKTNIKISYHNGMIYQTGKCPTYTQRQEQMPLPHRKATVRFGFKHREQRTAEFYISEFSVLSVFNYIVLLPFGQ